MTAASSAAATGARAVEGSATSTRATKYVVRGIALFYLALLLVLPVAMVFIRAFEGGLDPVLKAIGRPAFQSAFLLTLEITLIAVPLCTVMGVITALAIARRRFPGRSLLNALVDLPFALSPVVIGLSLFIVYGAGSPIGQFLADNGITVIFALPGMILATVFVCLPFVIREVVPVLREIGTDQEEAAYTLGAGPLRTFWKVTLPAIRWGVVYGVILTTARSLGEFGAVAIVSGKISGKTITLTTHVQERYEAFDVAGAYTASIVLASMALVVLLAMRIYQAGGIRRGAADAERDPEQPQGLLFEPVPAATESNATESNGGRP
jgi:sulfate transport system permease protein